MSDFVFESLILSLNILPARLFHCITVLEKNERRSEVAIALRGI